MTATTGRVGVKKAAEASESGRSAKPPLSDERCRLVRENIGLVNVHLRRNVSNLATPRRDREWDDLFQEGCLGLMQAASTFKEESGIPFAAYALPRIHNAVSRALHSKFTLIYVPPQRDEGRRRSQCEAERVGQDDGVSSPSPYRVRVRSLSEYDEARLSDRRRHHPGEEPTETVGERLRGKYERAVREAGDRLSVGASRRGDRGRLVDVLVHERMLIPDDESRTALRRIARETESSYARVAQCSNQLVAQTRKLLEDDPEFDELRRRARRSEDGMEHGIDERLERSLAVVGADEFASRFRGATSSERTILWDALSEGLVEEIAYALGRGVERLSMLARENLLRKSSPQRDAVPRAIPAESLKNG